MISQYRFYGYGNNNNNPAVDDESKLSQWVSIDSNIFSNKEIKKLGIQTIPGIVFYFNNNKDYPITVGYTGIYELDVTDKTTLTNLCFDIAQLKQLIVDSPGAYLIVDIISEEIQGGN